MAILKFISSVATIVIYFFISLLVPVFSYLVPYYRITKVRIYGRKYANLVNALVLIVLGLINIRLMILYIIIPFLTEILLRIVAKLQLKGIGPYDRIVIMSLISSGAVLAYLYIDRDFLFTSLQSAVHMLEKMDSNFVSEVKVIMSMDLLKATIIPSIFSYIFLANIFLFFSLGANTYKHWTLSCYWLLPFMTIIFGQQFLNIESTIISANILDITRFIFVWYGIKCIYGFLDGLNVKSNILKHIISIGIGVFYPMIAFVFGALMSFDVIESRDIKI